MKKMILVASTLLISMLAFAETHSQSTAKDIVNILQSQEVQSLLAQEDGVGNLRGISYLFSYRASFGPAIYELSFESNSGPVPQICTAPVQVNMQTGQVMKVDSAACKEIK
jgi:hypothetical protein